MHATTFRLEDGHTARILTVGQTSTVEFPHGREVPLPADLADACALFKGADLVAFLAALRRHRASIGMGRHTLTGSTVLGPARAE